MADPILLSFLEMIVGFETTGLVFIGLIASASTRDRIEALGELLEQRRKAKVLPPPAAAAIKFDCGHCRQSRTQLDEPEIIKSITNAGEVRLPVCHTCMEAIRDSSYKQLSLYKEGDV